MRLSLKLLTILACVSLLAACNTPGAQAPASTADVAPTLNAARTEAAETVEAELASRPTATSLPATPTLAPSATEVPSVTPVPSNTPAPATNTPPPTNTAVKIVVTNTPANLDCSITASSPDLGASFPTGADFDARWTIKNIGTKTWAAAEMDYRYVSGEKMYADKATYDLSKDVAPGESIELIVDMLAPSTAGNYTSRWALSFGTTSICVLPVSINVK